VYVGNLSFTTSWQNLKDHMRSAGFVIRAEVLSDAEGRSRGCGVVEYATASEAQAAVTSLTDTELDGRLIFVREDRVSTGDTSRDGDADSRSRRVYIGNLAWSVNWKKLKDLLRQCGEVRVDVAMEGDRSKGYAIAEFVSASSAAACIQRFNDVDFEGRALLIREDRELGPTQTSSTKRLYIGNLAWSVDWRMLKDILRQYGDVTRVEVMMDEDTHRSKGYAIAEFNSAAGAAACMLKLNNFELEGRLLNIREDREPPMMALSPSSPMGRTSSAHIHPVRSVVRSSSIGTATATNARLFINNLAWNVAWQDLKDHFKVCGDVVRADVALEEETGRSRGFGFVEFSSPEDAIEAVRRLNNSMLLAREIYVREDRDAHT
jgi:RNA recognition motif-containing protein